MIDAEVAVLTNVGLEHTRWLGPTVRDIATEKLAVVRAGATLALGADLDPEALAVAGAVAADRGARIVRPAAALSGTDSGDPRGGTHLGLSRSGARSGSPVRGTFQRRNFALARVAAEAYLSGAGIALREEAVRAAAAATVVRGRLEVVSRDPLTVLDGAHNPDAVAALVESLPEVVEIVDGSPGEPGVRAGLGAAGERSEIGQRGGRPLALVLGVLEDKDAAGMLALLLPWCARAWFTAPRSSRALSPAALQSLARQLGFERAVCERHPRRALEQAQAWARGHGGGGDGAAGAAVLATGSIYLVGELLGRSGA